ncbi:MAG: ABC transporter ATP-binding protein [Chloroflexi bacterium]|nr:ABC transporter ATP-binding protein [Chloroflexota bacterium]
MLQVDGLSFAYPGRPPTLHGVGFGVGAGEVLCLLGPNGTGKTTLLRCLVRLAKPSNGAISIGGRDTASMTAKELARHVAYVPQASSTVFPFSLLDIVVMGRSPHLGFMQTPTAHDRQVAQAALERVGIGHLATRPCTQVSGGERQLALIARALAQEASILVMDEPTASLDYGNQVRMLRLVKGLAAAGHTVVMTSHVPSHAFECAHQVALMKEGRIAALGPPDEVISGASLSALYGVDVRVVAAAIEEHEPATVKVCVPMLA